MKINLVLLIFIIFLTSCQEATVPFFANEESVKRELENDFICDELARANQPYANSGEVSGVGRRQAFNICTPAQFLNIGKRKQDWDKYFNIRADLNFKEELLLVGVDFFPIGEITYYSDYDLAKNDRLAFTGVIDGKGHSILRLSILFDKYNKRSIGIFPYIAKSGELRNINFENIRIIHETGEDFIDDTTTLSIAGSIVGLSDGARFENIRASRVQLIHEFQNEKSSVGIFSGVLINSILNGVSVYSNQSSSQSEASGGLAGIVLGGRFTGINVEVAKINGISNSGGFAGVIEGKSISILNDIVDAPIDVVAISDLSLKMLEDQDSIGFGGVAKQAHDLSIESAVVELKKITNIEHHTGGLFGFAEELELHNSEVILNDNFVGADVCNNKAGRIGAAFGELMDSEVGNLSIEVNYKSMNLNDCKNVGMVAGKVSDSNFSNIDVKNAKELNGHSLVGGFFGEMISSTLEKSIISINKITAGNEYSFNTIEPNSGALCFAGAFVGGAVGVLGQGSLLKDIKVTAEEVVSKTGKAAAVGGLVGFNLGNIYESLVKTKIVKGAHFVGGLVGMNLSNEISGKIKNNQVENTDYISGWKSVGGIVGASGLEFDDTRSKPFCGDDFKITENDNHLGGEILYNSAKINNIYAFEKMGGAIGSVYKSKVNSSFVHVDGFISKWEKSNVDINDHEPASTPEINENMFGGFIGESVNSSTRNSYVTSRNLNEINLKGLSSVGGFVGKSEDSQFFYNFSNLNTLGKNKETGSCANNDLATSKVECEFDCKNSESIQELSYHRASACEDFGTFDEFWENIFSAVIFIASDAISNSIKATKADSVKCKNIKNDADESILNIEQCLSTFTCLKGNGEIDTAITDQKSCETMGYCGAGDMLYSNSSSPDGTVDENGYVNERDCCINGGKHFLANRWVRNYWVTEESDKTYTGNDNYWSRNSNVWSDGVVDKTSRVPKVGKFAGNVDISYDEGSNSLQAESVFVGNYSKGECLNPNNGLIQSEFGERIDEYSTDDSDFYECKDSIAASQGELKNQLACNRLGDCNVDPDQVTRGKCIAKEASDWTPNSWEPKSDAGSFSTSFGPVQSCVDLNQKNIKEKININLSIEDRQNLDTCNDSILRQLGRQDQILYSNEKFSPDYFNYSYHPPMNFWNFNYFWEEVENDVPVLYR